MKTHKDDIKKDWLSDISDSMAGFETDAPPGLWDDIEKSLAEAEKPVPVVRKRMLTLWARRLTDVAAIVLVALTAGLFLTRQDDRKQEEEAPLMAVATEPETKDIKGGNVMTAHEYAARSGEEQGVAMAAPHRSSNRLTEATAEPVEAEASDTDNPEANDSQTESPATENATDRKPDENTPAVKRPADSGRSKTSSPRTAPSFANTTERKSGGMQVSMFTSGGTGASMNRHTAGELYAINGIQYAPPAWKDNNSLGMSLLNKGLDTDTEYKHRLPVRAGLSVGWRLNDRWAVETGLTYANLASDVRDGSRRNYYTGEQRLHYLGIPVSARYRIFGWKRLGVYATTGVLAEQCVKATLKKEYVLNNADNGSETENLKSRPLQMSVNAGVGVDFNIVDAVSIYAEPGASYYFDDRSSLNTIYKEKPFNFNFNFGLRLTFGK